MADLPSRSPALYRHRWEDYAQIVSGLRMVNDFKDIAVWENRRRLSKLKRFHGNVIEYFDSTGKPSLESLHNDSGEAGRCRQKINLTIIEIRDIVKASRVPDSVAWTPPPAIGGRTHRVRLLDDLFYLDDFSISASSVVDMLERSIGVYIGDWRNSFWRTLNPFWWMFKVIKWLSRIPFLLLNSAGFDANKAENSLPGRLLKVAISSVIVSAALLTSLELIGWLDEAMKLVGIGP